MYFITKPLGEAAHLHAGTARRASSRWEVPRGRVFFVGGGPADFRKERHVTVAGAVVIMVNRCSQGWLIDVYRDCNMIDRLYDVYRCTIHRLWLWLWLIIDVNRDCNNDCNPWPQHTWWLLTMQLLACDQYRMLLNICFIMDHHIYEVYNAYWSGHLCSVVIIVAISFFFTLLSWEKLGPTILAMTCMGLIFFGTMGFGLLGDRWDQPSDSVKPTWQVPQVDARIVSTLAFDNPLQGWSICMSTGTMTIRELEISILQPVGSMILASY